MTREVLLIAIDTNPLEWAGAGGEHDISFNEFLDQVFAFVSQIVLADVVQICPIVAYDQRGASWLFPQPDQVENMIAGRMQATNEEEMFEFCQMVVGNLHEFASRHVDAKCGAGVRLDLALSLALCHLNRYPASTRKRVLVLTRSQDSNTNVESTMNAVFAAQRIDAIIDSVIIKQKMSLFLNQAARITGGVLIPITTLPNCLIQYLLSIPPAAVRGVIAVKKVETIDYRAPAANTDNLIDTGMMCPICLSIFEETGKSKFSCSVCGARQLTGRKKV